MKKRHLTVMPGVLLALLLTGLLIACPGTTVPVTVAVTGTLSYDPINTTYGTEATASPTWAPPLDGETVSYTISPADITGISIDAGTGVVTVGVDAVVAGATDYTVTATGTGSYTGTKAATISITVSTSVPDTENPEFTSGDTATAIAENSGSGQVIYTAVATDDSSVTYTLGTAGDRDLFTISGDKVTLTANPDYETKNSYIFDVIATDAADNSATRTVTLAITDVNDNDPVIITTTLTATIADGRTGVVYTVTSTDEDTVGNITYTLGGTDSNAFTIADNGEVTIKSAAVYNSTKPSYSFTITASDGVNDSAAVTVTITVADPNAENIAPTVRTSIANVVDERIGIAITDIDVSDHFYDANGDTLTFSANGLPSGLAINQETGIISGIPTGTAGTFTVTVTADDGTGTVDSIFSFTLLPALIDISGSSMIYNNIYVQSGTSISKNVTGDITGQTVNYSISPVAGGDMPIGITIALDSGRITLSDTVAIQTQTWYTVTATGYGDYTGTKTAPISITVDAKDITGMLSYDSIDTPYGTETTASPTWDPVLGNQTVSYTISPDNVDGISIDADDGTVTVGTNAVVADSGTYTVTATGITNFTGTRTADIVITVNIPPGTLLAADDATFPAGTVVTAAGPVTTASITGNNTDSYLFYADITMGGTVGTEDSHEILLDAAGVNGLSIYINADAPHLGLIAGPTQTSWVKLMAGGFTPVADTGYAIFIEIAADGSVQFYAGEKNGVQLPQSMELITDIVGTNSENTAQGSTLGDDLTWNGANSSAWGKFGGMDAKIDNYGTAIPFSGTINEARTYKNISINDVWTNGDGSNPAPQ